MGKTFANFLRLFVHNDAMRNDPDEIFGWRVFALTCAACFGGMLFGWDMGAIGGIQTYDRFKEDFGFTDRNEISLSQTYVSTLLGGCFISSLVASPISDRLGRKPCLLISGLIAAVGVVLQAASIGSFGMMYSGRFVSGLGVGAASMLAPLYVSECAPRAIRGGLTGLYQLFIVSGTMLAFWVNYGCLAISQEKPRGYVLPLALQGLPALCLVFGILPCPESPRWCARQQRWARATEILSRLSSLPSDHAYVKSEINDMSFQLDFERKLTGDATMMILLREMWTIPSNRKRALISVGLLVCQQMTGLNAINYYAPEIFQDMGLSNERSALFATGVYGIIKVASCACFLLFAADTLGRRRSLLWTSVGQSITMFLVGVYIRTNPPSPGGEIPPFGYFAMACIYIFTVCYQFGWGPCCWIYVSEIPTARLRSMNVALAAATQWLFNYVIGRTVLTMIDTMGPGGYGTFFLFGSFCALSFLFVFFLIPETKGLSLEKMDELFGITEDLIRLSEDNEGHSSAGRVNNSRTYVMGPVAERDSGATKNSTAS